MMMTSCAQRQSTGGGNEARTRQVSFWKKHQMILQNCADLSNMCNVKILVSSDC